MPVTSDQTRRTIHRPGGGDITILVPADESGGSMSMIETLSQPGGGPTYHSHSREDETFYVVSGTADIRIADQVFRSRPAIMCSGRGMSPIPTGTWDRIRSS